jgi:zinc transporter family protein
MVPAELSVEAGHQVAVAVRTRLIERVEHREEVIVHVDPPGAAGEAHRAERPRVSQATPTPRTLTLKGPVQGAGRKRFVARNGRRSDSAAPAGTEAG